MPTSGNPVLRESDGVSLRDYVDMRFDENRRAIDKAESTMNSRLEGMNEFRDALKDNSAKFITREEASLMIRPLLEDIKYLRSCADKAEGKASQTAMLITLVGSLIGIVLGIVNFFK